MLFPDEETLAAKASWWFRVSQLGGGREPALRTAAFPPITVCLYYCVFLLTGNGTQWPEVLRMGNAFEWLYILISHHNICIYLGAGVQPCARFLTHGRSLSIAGGWIWGPLRNAEPSPGFVHLQGVLCFRRILRDQARVTESSKWSCVACVPRGRAGSLSVTG